MCTFVALDDRSCPFELWFGRWQDEGIIGFHVGLGGTVWDVSDEMDALNRGGLPRTQTEADGDARTMERFLRSSVHCEIVETPRGIEEATYRASLLPLGSIVRARPSEGGWFQRRTTRVVEYEPWLR